MLNAKEARKITEEAITLAISERKHQAKEFCERISENIKKACNEKRDDMFIENIPAEIYSYVWGILRDNGYETIQLSNHTIQISW